MSSSARQKRSAPIFLVRTCVDRLAGDGKHTVATDMAKAEIKGRYSIEVRDANGNPDIVDLDIKFERLHLLPPIGKQKQYPPLDLTVVHVKERGKPKKKNRKLIDWKLITDLPVRSLKDAKEKTTVVCAAVENRDVSQGSEVWLQSGRVQAADC